MSSQVMSALGNVKSYRGHAVLLGVVQVTDSAFIEHLDNTYAEAVICNLNIKPGEALQQLKPLMFAGLAVDHQQDLQWSLLSQITQGNDVDIEFHM